MYFTLPMPSRDRGIAPERASSSIIQHSQPDCYPAPDRIAYPVRYKRTSIRHLVPKLLRFQEPRRLFSALTTSRYPQVSPCTVSVHMEIIVIACNSGQSLINKNGGPLALLPADLALSFGSAYRIGWSAILYHSIYPPSLSRRNKHDFV